MTTILINYETIYESLRREKFRKELQLLDKDFIKNVVKYLKEKEEIIISQKQKGGTFSKEVEKTENELLNTKKMIKELYEKRESKIMNLALISSRGSQSAEDIKVMLEEEKSLYESLIEPLNSHKKKLLDNLLNGFNSSKEADKPEDIKIDEKEGKKSLIRFLQPIPKFVAEDLNIYGPFDEEDIGFIPEKSAEVLITKNKAEEIKTNESKKNN
ncbi:MAG: hypothetical protein HYS32_01480 [Candidatus Woesearchaeota archaeon]|nr:MAG: hypothetical protein HYS32_01480 [Candidatus Woesearchaeota archaeon]